MNESSIPISKVSSTRHSRLGDTLGDIGVLIAAAGMLGLGVLVGAIWTPNLTNSKSSTTTIGPSPQPTIQAISEEAFAEQVRVATNNQRIAAGLPALGQSLVLDLSAEAKLRHLLKHNYWAHIAPDGTSPWSFLDLVGYGYAFAGENLARDYNDAEDVVNAWMSSETHRQNLLSSQYTEMGIAARNRESNWSYWSGDWIVVAHYASPL